MAAQQTVLKMYFGFLSLIAPTLAAKKGFDIFQKVRKKDIRPREESFFRSARHFRVAVTLDKNKDDQIDCYELGDANHALVILVHGWDSNAGSMSQIANRLVEEGKRVVLFNLPGHAFSVHDSTNLLECKNAVTAVLNHLKPMPGFSVVSHSFGSAVVAYALSKNNYELDKLIFLTNPNRVERIFTDFKNFIGLSNRAYLALLKLTQDKLGEPIEAVSVAANLTAINYQKLLLIHDKNDKVLDYANSLEVKDGNPKVELLTFENIGHYKMLWNKEVINNCAIFLK
ncbi:MAG: pimeloyl-ACP methyl ester carboxylesterase [Crocinitomix sp.]|jgi:pimeloyl-ACP methyl ester carboxylesterase